MKLITKIKNLLSKIYSGVIINLREFQTPLGGFFLFSLLYIVVVIVNTDDDSLQVSAYILGLVLINVFYLVRNTRKMLNAVFSLQGSIHAILTELSKSSNHNFSVLRNDIARINSDVGKLLNKADNIYSKLDEMEAE